MALYPAHGIPIFHKPVQLNPDQNEQAHDTDQSHPQNQGGRYESAKIHRLIFKPDQRIISRWGSP